MLYQLSYTPALPVARPLAGGPKDGNSTTEARTRSGPNPGESNAPSIS